MSHYNNQREQGTRPKATSNNIFTRLNKKIIAIPHDKLLHLSVGLVIYSLTALFNPLLGLTAVLLVAGAKEIYDKATGKGTPELADFIYTVAMPTTLCTLSVALSTSGIMSC